MESDPFGPEEAERVLQALERERERLLRVIRRAEALLARGEAAARRIAGRRPAQRNQDQATGPKAPSEGT